MLKKGNQLSYGPIYSWRPVELKTYKTYIETNLAKNFIRTLKLPVSALILFVYKLDGSISLCVDYQGLNNFTIKN